MQPRHFCGVVCKSLAASFVSCLFITLAKSAREDSYRSHSFNYLLPLFRVKHNLGVNCRVAVGGKIASLPLNREKLTSCQGGTPLWNPPKNEKPKAEKKQKVKEAKTVKIIKPPNTPTGGL